MKLLQLTVLYALFAAPPGAMAGDETGAQLYAVYCTQCHGIEGNGRGVNAAHMSVLPRSHVDPVEMGARQDGDLFKVIQQGGPALNKSVLMPAWGDKLSDEQVEKLVRHLRVMCCGE